MTRHNDPDNCLTCQAVAWSTNLGWVTIPEREYCEHDLEVGSCPAEQGDDR